MRALSVILGALLILIQYPLWLGKGGWLKTQELRDQVVQKRAENLRLEARNESLVAEVRDLKSGHEAIEERARFELRFVKPDEVFFDFREAGRNAGESIPGSLPPEGLASARREMAAATRNGPREGGSAAVPSGRGPAGSFPGAPIR